MGAAGSGVRRPTEPALPRWRRTFLSVFFLLIAAYPLCAAPGPNILLILADDLAWSDLGCYGSTMCETPRLDRLAAQGLRFTDAYAGAPLCSPARAALMTGKTPARLHFEFVTKWRTDAVPTGPLHPLTPPPYTYDLPLEERTIAEVLRDAGYRTGMVGKWHLNSHYRVYNGWSPTHGPLQQGFEWARETFGSHPWAFASRAQDRFDDLPSGEYAPDGLTDAAIEFLRTRDERPFFLFVSHFYVHSPVRARGGWLVEKYRRKLGPAASENEILYGGFVETLDHHVGRLLDALDEQGLAESTLVVFASDNGGNPDFSVNAPLRGGKWNLYEGGVRTPLLARQPGAFAAGETRATPVNGPDLFATFADLAGAAEPLERLDGRSLLPVLARDEAPERDLVWHFPYYHPEKGYEEALPAIGVDDGEKSRTRPQASLRRGRYKALYFFDTQQAELYDLTADPAEQRDLAAAEPGRARELTQRLLDYLERVQARKPLPNPAYAP